MSSDILIEKFMGNLHEGNVIHDSQYHSSWDWLMPVLKKVRDEFESIGVDIYDKYESEVHEIEDAVWDGDIETVYRVVLVLINSYNKSR